MLPVGASGAGKQKRVAGGERGEKRGKREKAKKSNLQREENLVNSLLEMKGVHEMVREGVVGGC